MISTHLIRFDLSRLILEHFVDGDLVMTQSRHSAVKQERTGFMFGVSIDSVS